MAARSLIIGICLWLMAGAAVSGPVSPPFLPNFGTGAPGASTPVNQLYFDTSTTPFTGYVYDRTASAWEAFGSSGGGGACPAGTSGQVQATNGTACVGITNVTLTALIDQFATATSGAVPASPGGTSDFLRADGAWAPPPSGGSCPAGTSGQVQTTDGTDCVGITTVQLTALINQFTTALAGDVPVSPGGTTDFLRADGAWAAVPGGIGPCSSIFAAVQYDDAGNFGCAPMIVATSGPGAPEMQFTGTHFGAAGYDYFYADPINSNWEVAYNSFQNLTSGVQDYCEGTQSCNQMTSGSYDFGYGFKALFSVTQGNYNYAFGDLAGYGITTGSNNLCLGNSACDNSFVLTTGSNNIVLEAGPPATADCSMTSSNVNNEFDLCGNGSDLLPIERCNITSLAAGNCVYNVPLAPGTYTIGTLPSTPPIGSRASVTDALVCSFSLALTGGGSAFCPVVYTGSGWVGG